jgi:hypothetical protein
MGISAELLREMERLSSLIWIWEKAQHRPDDWEAGHIAIAIGAVAEEDAETAARCIDFAIMPHESRPPGSLKPPSGVPLMSLEEMRKTFDELKTEVLDDAERKRELYSIAAWRERSRGAVAWIT